VEVEAAIVTGGIERVGARRIADLSQGHRPNPVNLSHSSVHRARTMTGWCRPGAKNPAISGAGQAPANSPYRSRRHSITGAFSEMPCILMILAMGQGRGNARGNNRAGGPAPDAAEIVAELVARVAPAPAERQARVVAEPKLMAVIEG
jgi:hypothetical protein